jgi:hypothetical protein
MDRSLPIILAGTHGIAIRKRGLWIIGHTFTAARRAVAVSQERGQTLMFGVDVNVPQIARAGASGKWWSEKVAKPGWEHYIAVGRPQIYTSLGCNSEPRTLTATVQVPLALTPIYAIEKELS